MLRNYHVRGAVFSPVAQGSSFLKNVFKAVFSILYIDSISVSPQFSALQHPLFIIALSLVQPGGSADQAGLECPQPDPGSVPASHMAGSLWVWDRVLSRGDLALFVVIRQTA